MGWVCRVCSTNNDDSSDVCFVCGARREEHTMGTTEEGLAHEAIEVESEAIGGITEKHLPLVKAISVLFPILAFTIGQVILYVLFAKEEKVLFLTRFIRASGNYEFDVPLFLLLTSIAGGLSCIFAVCNNLSLAARGKEFCVYLSTLPFCIAMVLCPPISACWLLVLEFIGLFIRKRRAFIGIIILAILFALITIVVFPSVAAIIGETYTITFDAQGGEGGSTRKEAKFENEMPLAEAPIKEGYIFEGYYDSKSGGTQYYNSDMESVRKWDVREDCTLYAHWTAGIFIVELDWQGGSGGSDRIEVSYNASMPSATAPSRTGYTFIGYYDDLQVGVQYYDSNMGSSHKWDKPHGDTLYARWKANTYLVKLDLQGGEGISQVTVTYRTKMPTASKPSKDGFTFNGFYSDMNGAGLQYYDSEMKSMREWSLPKGGTLYAYWKSALRASAAVYSLTDISDSKSTTITVSNGSGSYSYSTMASSYSGVSVSISSNRITLSKTGDDKSGSITILVSDLITGATATCSIYYSTTGSCVATGTLITLADGTAVPVETLTRDELLLVWNMETGTFDSAPILFIDYEAPTEVNIIHLYFSDGTEVKVIGEHAFWDFNLNEYVFLRDNATKYIGHWFNKQNNEGEVLSWTKVQLVNVVFETEYMAAWSPVTYQHLCYYVNGMLSMPGATEGLINLFAVDGKKMMYSTDAREADIQKYGLFTYDEFCQIIQVPKEIFEAFHGEYLKVALGKGLISWERIAMLLERYKDWFL